MASRRSKDDLFRIGRKKGYVTLDEIIYNSPAGQSTEQVESLLEQLAERKIEVVGIDTDNEVEAAARSRATPTSAEMADPVTMYMRKLKSVPLLSKAAEVDAAQRIEAARREMLGAALSTSVAVDEMLQLARRVRAGKVRLDQVIEEQPLGETPHPHRDREMKEARERFLKLAAKLQRLDRQRRKLEERLARSRKRSEAERKQLRERLARRREEMLEILTQVDFREPYFEAVIKRIKDLAQRLEMAREEIHKIEQRADLSVAQLRRLLRQRKRAGAGLDGVATAELPDASAAAELAGEPDEPATLADEDLAELIRLLKNAERRIRAIERRSDVSAERLLTAHSKMLAAERRAQRAKDELVLANQRLVVHIASKYINRGLPFLELVQEGNLGLMRAVDKFDWRRGYKFSTYGTWWIRHAISRAIANQTRTIRLPVHVRDSIRKLVKESQRHVLEVGREPTADELAVRLEIPVERVVEIMEASRKTLRWELPVGEDGETELGALIADEQIPSPFEEVSNKGQWEQILKAMEGLRARERDVLTRRFGLDRRPPQTLEEVGKDLGITRERVRQIQARALRKLQLAVRSRTR